MHRLLQDLHRDHGNLERVLCLLERQLHLIRAGEHADLFMLCEVVDYVQNYPDRIHHPREDLVYAVFRERNPGHGALVERLLEEHRTLLASTAELKASLDQWQSDSPLPRELVVARISNYLRLQREHLQREEREIYGLLAEGLEDADWERIEASMPPGTDPLFGDPSRRRYETLYGAASHCA
ncbi:hemerythrin domain-containing protein [Candidatus Methylocalor cossyra]|uniref:Hemerythrin-like domain-containing protein n=1 Tax=Candidatus Methylocalor cossyra TaxID=3108543 RepID=A0ABP1CAW0_9GAMM